MKVYRVVDSAKSENILTITSEPLIRLDNITQTLRGSNGIYLIEVSAIVPKPMPDGSIGFFERGPVCEFFHI